MRLKNLLSISLFVVLSSLASPGQTTTAPQGISGLQRQISEHISQPRFDSALWGVKVVSLDSGKTLFETNGQKLFSPASNSKLYTVALALDRLGPDYQIKTSMSARTKPNRWGTLKSDLFIYGRGDPTINARVHDKDLFAALQPFVTLVTNAGIRRIKGDLVADETFFHGPHLGSGWAWDDLENYYGAEISALTFNDNTLQLAVTPGATIGSPCKLAFIPEAPFMVLSNLTRTASSGSRARISFFRPFDSNVVYVEGTLGAGSTNYLDDVTVHQPSQMFLFYLKQALACSGVRVDGKLRIIDPFPASPRADRIERLPLGDVPSLPLKDIVREIMKPSQNLYTDLLLEHVGEVSREKDPDSTARNSRRSRQAPALADSNTNSPDSVSYNVSSEDLGIRELNRFLASIGVKKGDVLFEEGSGLSRNNLTTPNATIHLLEYMHKHPAAAAYRDALPIAGVDGTLRNRMKGTAAAGNMRAKTGTLRWANSLSGYITSAAGEQLAFSIMLNRYHNPDARSSGRNEIDAIGVMLADLREKTVP